MEQLFRDRKWDKIINYSFEKVVTTLSFEDNLRLAYRLLYNNQWDELLQEYAIQLLYTVRNHYPVEWRASWRHDGFLGVACNIRFKYDERYAAFKRAYDNSSNPPPELLIELARCFTCPGSPPPISADQAISLLKESLKNCLYIEAVSTLYKIYWDINDYSPDIPRPLGDFF